MRHCLILTLLFLLFVTTPITFALRIHVPVTVAASPLNPRASCSGAFISHDLDHNNDPDQAAGRLLRQQRRGPRHKRSR